MNASNIATRSIISDLVISVHPEMQKRLLRIDSEDFSGTIKKTKEYFDEINFSYDQEYLENGIFALKQYYAVALLDPANAHAVSRPLDPFWHSHILHTEQYEEFCSQVVGEYMHHRPLDHDIRKHVAAVRRLYNYTNEVLPKLFNTIDKRFWPINVLDKDLICFHKGNQTIYLNVQKHRLFEPTQKGAEFAL